MFWHRRTVAVRVEKDILDAFRDRGADAPEPPEVSELLRSHLECQRRVESLTRTLAVAQRALEAAKAQRRELEQRYESLRTDHTQLLAERKRLEDRVQDLRRRLSGLRGAEVKVKGRGDDLGATAQVGRTKSPA